MTDMITNTDVFTYLGVSSPTAGQKAIMSVVRKGLEGSVRNFCNWAVTSDDYVFIMPRAGVVYANNVWTSQRVNLDNTIARSRIQLPVPYVSSVTSVHENFSAHGGEVANDFSSDFLLTEGDDWFLDIEGGGGSGNQFSKAGGILRVNRTWSSIPATIRIECTAGFDSSDFDDGEAAGFKNWLIGRTADGFMMQSRKTALTFSSGTGGLLTREKLGDYDVSYNASAIFSSTGHGLTQEDQDYLFDLGFVFCGVSC